MAGTVAGTAQLLVGHPFDTLKVSQLSALSMHTQKNRFSLKSGHALHVCEGSAVMCGSHV